LSAVARAVPSWSFCVQRKEFAMSVVATNLVTVNPAFLQEIKEVNEELWKLLHTARTSVADAVHVDQLPNLIPLLQELRDQLALHFALEESFGYFEDPAQVAPQLAKKALHLRDEHREIYVDLSDLVEQAERMYYDDQHDMLLVWLRPRFVRFDVRLKDHESRENELILDAYDCDIGVGD
jgi:hypothetical protein